MKLEDLIIPGAILIGGYFLLTKFKDLLPKLPGLPPSPVIPSPLDPILPTPKDIPPEVIPYIMTPPAPIDYGIPPLAIPKAITELSKPMGPGAPSTLDFLFPPIGILDAVNQLPKLIDATFPKALSPHVKRPEVVRKSPHTVTPSPFKVPIKTGSLNVGKTTFFKFSTGKIIIVPSYLKKRGF